MHVILVPYGSSGDTHPFLGIGRAMRGRGHRVSVVAIEHFGPLVRELGFEHEAIDEEGRTYEEVLNDPDLWHPVRGLKLVFRSVAGALWPIYETIERIYRPGESVIVAGTLAIGARIAEEKLGIPSATVHLQPTSFRSVHEMPELPGMAIVSKLPRFAKRLVYRYADAAVIDRHLGPPVNVFRRELGLGPVRSFLGDYSHSPHRVIGLFPDWFAFPQPDWPPQARLTGFPLYDEADVAPLEPELASFLDSGDPPVVVSFGSAMTQAGPQFAAMVEALRRVNRRGLFLTKFPDQIPAGLPEGIRHFAYAPFSQVLPRSAAIVHHGGIGTSAQAMASGIPQLISPMAFDQFDNAARLRLLGIGATVPRKHFRADRTASIRRIVEAMRGLLDDRSVFDRCQGVADRIRRSDPLGETCRVIEALLTDRPAD